jgi:serine/threonine-protein kinase HipA
VGDAQELRRVDSVRVVKNGETVGVLTRTLQGAEFVYDEAFRTRCLSDHSIGVACTLSPYLAKHTVTGANLHPFFAGLLPEGFRLKALHRLLKTSEDDLFTMLIALGEESIGDVFVVSDIALQHERIAPISLEQADFQVLLEESINPYLKKEAVDIGVPGVMPKLSASMITFPVRVRERKKEYILKLQPKEYPRLIQNEAFFMAMAKACGLNTAEVKTVVDFKGQSGLLVTRFDRVFCKETRTFQRLHQEDACQLLGAYPYDKYRLSAKKICEAIAKFSAAPVIDVKKFIDLYIFSYIIGNGDLHAKNVSLLAQKNSELLSFSPCYDIVSTIPYGDTRMAVQLGGRDDNFSRKDFVSFAAQFSIPAKAINSSLDKLIKKITPWTERIEEIGFERKINGLMQRTIQERIAQLV